MKSLQCDRCGGVLPIQKELGGRCTRCLLEMGVMGNTQELEDEDQLNTAWHLNAGSYIGRYRVLRSIGDGGMGVVYEAEQEQPRRHVALKLIRPGMAGKATLRRFERETQALGRLQHPGIAQIYEAGTADTGFGPQPYFAMELIRGLTPGEYVKKHRLSVRERLELVAKVAEAVHHAHQRGIIHRDLKPSNIIVDETGQPKVLDFGVSTIDDSAPHTRQTEKGQLLGTVAYMSPEQVASDPHEIDIRTDIYALGVILYELLADRPPYDVEGNLHDALTAVREVEPARLGTLVRDYKGDIETIAAKALEKDKNRRYTSAAELAADLRRFLSEEPIIARPPTAAYQLKKFARRNKVLVRAAAMMTLALVLGVIISTWQARLARLAEQSALQDRDRALQAEAMATYQRNLALDAQRQALAAGETASAERDRANVERNRAQDAEEMARREARVAETQRLVAITQYLIREALRPETARDDYDLASALIVQAHRFSTRTSAQPQQAMEDALQRGMLWNPLRHNMVSGGSVAYRTAALSPDGVLLAAGGDDEKVRVWNMRHPAEAPLLLDARGAQTQGISAVTFSNNGKLLAVGSVRGNGGPGEDTVRIWNLESRDPPIVLKGAGNIDSLSFSPDSRHLTSVAIETELISRVGTVLGAAGQRRGTTRPPTPWPALGLWDLRNPGTPQVLSRDPAPYSAIPYGRVSYSPDGSQVAAALGDSVQLWALKNPEAAPLSLPWPETLSSSSSASRSVHSVAFSPDGIHLAASSSMGVHVWNLRSLQAPPIALPMPLSSGRPEFRLLSYNREGNRLAGVQDSIWIWDLRNPTAGPSNYGNNNSSPINGMAFSLDGTRVAGATPTGVQVWDLSSMADPSAPSAPLPRDPRINSVQPPTLGALVYSTDLTRAVDARSGILRLWDLRSATPLAATFEGQFPRLDGVAFCKNDTRVALLSASRFSFWDIGAGVQEPRRLLSLNFSAASPGIACSPDGTRLALTEVVRPADTSTKSVRVIDPTGRIIDSAIMPLDPAIVPALTAEGSLVFSPNGNTLAISMGQAVYLWNLQGSETAMRKLTMPSPALPIRLVFSSDGSKFAASSDANTGQTAVWDLKNPHSPPLQLPSSLAMALSHDGGRLATSNGDNLRVWDLRNPTTPSVNLQWRGGRIATLVFTPENRMLKAGDVDGRVAQLPLWSAAAEALCTRVWRNLSKSEWNAHVGEDIPYEKTCPNLPPGVGTPGGPK